MSENIIIISHRRSGTHLTIDSIRNNIINYKERDYLVLNEKISNEEYKKHFLSELKKKSNVIKTHFLPDFSLYNFDNEMNEQLNTLFDNSNLIYVYRNGLDVMVSLFEYMKKYDSDVQNISFNEFLNTYNNFDNTTEKFTRTNFWKYHIQEWQNSKYKDRIMWIKYEDLITNYDDTILKICQNFRLTKTDKLIDIRLQQNNPNNRILRKIKNKLSGIQKTSVSARKGVIGDYKNYFSDSTLNNFLAENSNFLKELGYLI